MPGTYAAGMSVIVVTGAAAGMGAACLDHLRGRSDHLVAVDLQAPDIDGSGVGDLSLIHI